MLSNDSINNKEICLALDAMGGDNAPASVIFGSNIFAKTNPNAKFLFFGNQNKINPLLKKCPFLQGKSEVIHTDSVISPDDKASVALRKGRKSSMYLAIDAVKNKKADAIISAGNTGVLMAMSKLSFRTLEGIDRPAIATIMPSSKGKVILLDMGANVVCDENNLVQFAIMGDAFAKVSLKIEKPSIGLLNIGSEDLKGNEVVKSAHQIMSEERFKFLNYYGYVEGDDIMKGTTEIVVTDGFSGNIALKTIEGTAKFLTKMFKEGFKKSVFAKIGLLFAAYSLKKTFEKIDPRKLQWSNVFGFKKYFN